MQKINLILWATIAVTVAACSRLSDCAQAVEMTPATVSGYAGVWKTSYGDVYFPKSTSSDARGAFWSYPDSNGKADNGRIIATTDGHKLVGYWVEDSGERPCATQKDGSSHWGPVHFEANEDFTVIAGAWGFCDKLPEGEDAGWVGTRD